MNNTTFLKKNIMSVSVLNVPHLVLAVMPPGPSLDCCSRVHVVVHDVQHQAAVLADDVVPVHPPLLVLPPVLVIPTYPGSWVLVIHINIHHKACLVLQDLPLPPPLQAVIPALDVHAEIVRIIQAKIKTI